LKNAIDERDDKIKTLQKESRRLQENVRDLTAHQKLLRHRVRPIINAHIPEQGRTRFRQGKESAD
jgi:predicted nuclease with TOPRIM domain